MQDLHGLIRAGLAAGPVALRNEKELRDERTRSDPMGQGEHERPFRLPSARPSRCIVR